jgi:hypothetical protein
MGTIYGVDFQRFGSGDDPVQHPDVFRLQVDTSRIL